MVTFNFKGYDDCMSQVYNELADEEYYQKLEDELHDSLKEQEMWFKYEDYMLWDRQFMY